MSAPPPTAPAFLASPPVAARPPLPSPEPRGVGSVWVAVLALLVLVVLYFFWVEWGGAPPPFGRAPPSGRPPPFGRSTAAPQKGPSGGKVPAADCTNWTAAGQDVGSVLPRCGGGGATPRRPRIVHGNLTAYADGGAACYSETLTGDVASGRLAAGLAARAREACGGPPKAYIGQGAYLCAPPGGRPGGDAPSCRQFVLGPPAPAKSPRPQ